MSPLVRFERMQLHTLRLGTEIQKDSARDGIEEGLAWLPRLAGQRLKIQSFFSATDEQLGATSGTGSVVQQPIVDLGHQQSSLYPAG